MDFEKIIGRCSWVAIGAAAVIVCAAIASSVAYTIGHAAGSVAMMAGIAALGGFTAALVAVIVAAVTGFIGRHHCQSATSENSC